MREIKVRAWGKNSKEYLGYGTKDGISLTLKNIQNIEYLDSWIFEQSTGLKDKNGKDIYEGDIISFENEKGLAKVLWLDGKAMFGIKWLDCGVKDELDYWNVCRGPAEVVGNIHDNPELLEGKCD